MSVSCQGKICNVIFRFFKCLVSPPQLSEMCLVRHSSFSQCIVYTSRLSWHTHVCVVLRFPALSCFSVCVLTDITSESLWTCIKCWSSGCVCVCSVLEKHEDQLQGLVWKEDGSLLASSCKVTALYSISSSSYCFKNGSRVCSDGS